MLKKIFLALSLAATLALVGCGGSDGGGSSPPKSNGWIIQLPVNASGERKGKMVTYEATRSFKPWFKGTPQNAQIYHDPSAEP